MIAHINKQAWIIHYSGELGQKFGASVVLEPLDNVILDSEIKIGPPPSYQARLEGIGSKHSFNVSKIWNSARLCY